MTSVAEAPDPDLSNGDEEACRSCGDTSMELEDGLCPDCLEALKEEKK